MASMEFKLETFDARMRPLLLQEPIPYPTPRAYLLSNKRRCTILMHHIRHQSHECHGTWSAVSGFGGLGPSACAGAGQWCSLGVSKHTQSSVPLPRTYIWICNVDSPVSLFFSIWMPLGRYASFCLLFVFSPAEVVKEPLQQFALGYPFFPWWSFSISWCSAVPTFLSYMISLLMNPS